MQTLKPSILRNKAHHCDHVRAFVCTLACVFAFALASALASALAPSGAAWAAEDPARVKSVRHAVSNGVQTVTVNIDKFDSVTVATLTDPERLVIDIKGAVAPASLQSLAVGVGPIATVRYAQLDMESSEGEKVVRVVIDCASRTTFTLNTGKGFIKAEARTGVGKSKTAMSIPVYDEDGSPKATARPAASPAATAPPAANPAASAPPRQAAGRLSQPSPAPADGNGDLSDRTPRPRRTPQPTARPEATPRVRATPSPSTTPWALTTPEPTPPQASGATMKITVPNAQPPQQAEAVRKNTHAVLDNITYYKTGSRAFLTLQRTAVEKNGTLHETYYKSSYANDGRVWELVFASELGSLRVGEASIGDGLVDKVAVTAGNGQTKLAVVASQPVVVTLYTKSQPSFGILETTISITPKPNPKKPLVAIDAGHGGHDPGTVAVNGSKEKDYALDMALRLKSSLEKLGIGVFLTRDNDFYPELYERSRLANDLGADLFVSIHVNSADKNPSARGTETLFYPSQGKAGQLTGRMFAEIMQKNLISTLHTTDRGIVERPNLVVLYSTNMPSVIVETAFASNKGDVEFLESAAFRKRVAGAVSDSVMQALGMLAK